jgi:hypothetical protein
MSERIKTAEHCGEILRRLNLIGERGEPECRAFEPRAGGAPTRRIYDREAVNGSLGYREVAEVPMPSAPTRTEPPAITCPGCGAKSLIRDRCDGCGYGKPLMGDR